jgi:RNA polymerase sigma-70 factor (ECF subfamily)
MTLSFLEDTTDQEVPTLGLHDVYEVHFGYVWAAVKRLGARPSDQEDLVHDVFVTFMRTLDRYDHSRPLRPWLCGIAFRIVSEHRRKASTSREIPVSEHRESSPGLNPAQALEATRRKQSVNEALNELSEDERAILVMVEVLGHSVVEASEVLHTNENTLYSRLRKARKMFAAALRRMGAVRGGV